MRTEFQHKYRPRTFKTIVGQKEAVAQLTTMVNKGTIPHALLLSGPSGCGKTTIARILQTVLGCNDVDYQEINAADFRGIDTIRDIRKNSYLCPMGGKSKIYLIDEAQGLPTIPQNALLKLLEDYPKTTYFILATTDPAKLLPTIKTRCTQIKLGKVGPRDIEVLLNRVAEKEKIKLGEEVRDKIIEIAEGSPRKALVLLEQVSTVTDSSEESQIAILEKSDSVKKAIDLAHALINPGNKWKDVAKILKELDDDAETCRRTALAYCSSVLLGGGKLAPRAARVMSALQYPTYDSGMPGLHLFCYEPFHSQE